MRSRSLAGQVIALVMAAMLSATACGSSDGVGDSGDADPGDEGEGDLTGGEMILRDFSLPLPLFSEASAWNQSGAEAAVLPDSDDQILATYRQLIGDSSRLVPGDEELSWPFMVVNYDAFSYPIFLAGDGIDDVSIRDYDGQSWFPSPTFPAAEQEGGPVAIPPPAGRIRPAGPTGLDSDGHVVLYDPAANREYDFWQATTAEGGSGESLGGGRPGATIIAAGAIEMFDLTGAGANPPGLSSARAMGTPLLGGLLVPEDLERGAIAHALAFALPGPRNLSDDPFEPLNSDWSLPASTTETDYYSTDPDALAAGQRIRLRSGIVDDQGELIDENDLAPVTRLFLEALREHGAILVDASAGFTFYAEDIHTANLTLSDADVNELTGKPPDAPLDTEKTKWQIVMEALGRDLDRIPLASGSWPDNADPSTATVGTSNFDVIESTIEP
ncbi:MAG: hypothetical protein OEU32_09555 [Acidimicrobiia bacterium]|nr:hypothetical protein [Acidimicrobiia bacterium]